MEDIKDNLEKTCKICQKIFTERRNLYQHMRRVHGVNWKTYYATSNAATDDQHESDPETTGKSICSICDRIFTAKKNLYQHIRRVHNATCIAEGSRKCPFATCEFSCRLQKDLRDHCITFHDITMERQTFVFKTHKDFKNWKEQEESSSQSCYVSDGSAKTTSSGCSYSYICHRAGSYLSQSTGKRQAKTNGSCKTGRWCISSIHVKRNGDVHNVEYYPIHAGHAKDVLRIPRAEKKKICEKFRTGVTVAEVLEEEQQSENPANQVVTKKQLYNLKHKFDMNPKTDFTDTKKRKEETTQKVGNMIELLKLSNYNAEVAENVDYWLQKCISCLQMNQPDIVKMEDIIVVGDDMEVIQEVEVSQTPVVVEFVQMDHNYR